MKNEIPTEREENFSTRSSPAKQFFHLEGIYERVYSGYNMYNNKSVDIQRERDQRGSEKYIVFFFLSYVCAIN